MTNTVPSPFNEDWFRTETAKSGESTMGFRIAFRRIPTSLEIQPRGKMGIWRVNGSTVISRGNLFNGY
ncbi:hypothetical protein CEXT_473331 [Caerostris extrusa]|uniref:Uncharacterized protein n=1 Tax=Caerostris extrusa TaxID=172846 RepID=A0AAV4S2X0_CAEEX|nr:hypothetical protein CEXT_473331 [Caerostris extrusa]